MGQIASRPNEMLGLFYELVSNLVEGDIMEVPKFMKTCQL